MSGPVFKDDVKVVIARRFAYEHIANLYAAKLNSVGIPCFLSNSNVGTMMPLSEGSFVMHVAEADLNEALEVMQKMDQNANQPADQDYRDANHGDIEYAKNINRLEERMARKEGRTIVLGVLLLAFVIAVFVVFQQACGN